MNAKILSETLTEWRIAIKGEATLERIEHVIHNMMPLAMTGEEQRMAVNYANNKIQGYIANIYLMSMREMNIGLICLRHILRKAIIFHQDTPYLYGFVLDWASKLDIIWEELGGNAYE